MSKQTMSNWIETQYLHLLEDILEKGVKKTDRTGTGTLSIFGRQIRHNMKDGFPVITTKKLAFKTMVTELLWFLRGDTNIKYLVDNNCHIWDGDSYKNYLSIVKKNTGVSPVSKEKFIELIRNDDQWSKSYGDLGPIYGKQWRNWDIKPNIETKSYIHKGETHFTFDINERPSIDQIANLISELKTNPDSRRLMVNAYNIGELDQMVLPPCHYGFQVYTRELTWDERHELAETKYQIDDVDDVLDKEGIPTRAISLMYNCRSQDVPLGTPFNISSYALLLEIIAKMVNMVPDELITNMGDCHIYLNQIDGVKEQLTREPYPLPKLVISNQVNFNEGLDEFLNSCLISDFQIEGYQSHPAIKMPLSN